MSLLISTDSKGGENHVTLGKPSRKSNSVIEASYTRSCRGESGETIQTSRCAPSSRSTGTGSEMDYSDPTYRFNETVDSNDSDESDSPSDEGSTYLNSKSTSAPLVAATGQPREKGFMAEMNHQIHHSPRITLECDHPDDEATSTSVKPLVSPHSPRLALAHASEDSLPGQGLAFPQIFLQKSTSSETSMSRNELRCKTPPPNPAVVENYSSDEEEVNLPLSCQLIQAADNSFTKERLRHSQQSLSWRMDPDHSLSDWRIDIFNRSTKAFKTYHVHRVVLAVGPRACGHFQRAFAQAASAPKHLTRIPLISEACNLVPDLFDYVYGIPSFVLRTENAAGLAYLATYLQQSQLLEETMTFICNDLSMDSIQRYLQDAIYYDLHDILDIIIQFGAQELPMANSRIPSVSGFLEDLPPDMFSQVLHLVSPRDRLLPNLSNLLVEYCTLHQHQLTLSHLHTWTNQLSTLTTESAILLLELELTLTGFEPSNSSSACNLLRRCLDVLAQDWQALCDNDRSTLSVLVEKVMLAANSPMNNAASRKLLADWLSQILCNANTQIQSSQLHLDRSLEREAALQCHLEASLEQTKKSQSELDALHRILESTKAELKEQLNGWMRKRSNDLVQHQALEQLWIQERNIWKDDREKWLEERGTLELELFRAKAELADLRQSRCNQHIRRHAPAHQHAHTGKMEASRSACPQMETASIFSFMSTKNEQDWDSDSNS